MNEPEWQLIDSNEWLYGVKIRGVVRDWTARAYYIPSTIPDDKWVWSTAETWGRCKTRGDAILAAEKSMGVI